MTNPEPQNEVGHDTQEQTQSIDKHSQDVSVESLSSNHEDVPSTSQDVSTTSQDEVAQIIDENKKDSQDTEPKEYNDSAFEHDNNSKVFEDARSTLSDPLKDGEAGDISTKKNDSLETSDSLESQPNSASEIAKSVNTEGDRAVQSAESESQGPMQFNSNMRHENFASLAPVFGDVGKDRFAPIASHHQLNGRIITPNHTRAPTPFAKISNEDKVVATPEVAKDEVPEVATKGRSTIKDNKKAHRRSWIRSNGTNQRFSFILEQAMANRSYRSRTITSRTIDEFSSSLDSSFESCLGDHSRFELNIPKTIQIPPRAPATTSTDAVNKHKAWKRMSRLFSSPPKPRAKETETETETENETFSDDPISFEFKRMVHEDSTTHKLSSVTEEDEADAIASGPSETSSTTETTGAYDGEAKLISETSEGSLTDSSQTDASEVSEKDDSLTVKSRKSFFWQDKEAKTAATQDSENKLKKKRSKWRSLFRSSSSSTVAA